MTRIATETNELKDEPKLNHLNKLSRSLVLKTKALTFKKYLTAAIFPKGRARAKEEQ